MDNGMTISQAARWAESKDCLVRMDRDGCPDWMYAAYDPATNRVECIGFGDKCHDYRDQQLAAGRHVICVALDQIAEAISEAEGEARCMPEPGYMREWA